MDEVDKICAQIHRLQTTPSSTFLRPEYFKVKHEVLGTLSGELLADSDIREVDGNYSSRDQRVRGKFILESKTGENDVKFISRLLDKRELPAGIPRCLGYRQPPYNDPAPPHQPIFELVFEAPTSPYLSLATILTNEPMPAFDERVQLAKQVVKAVLNVHNLGLVHKAIRSRAILVANYNGQNTITILRQISSLYLLDWTYVREASAATSMSGGELSWPRMIYQHPERQGSPGHYPEKEYEAKHDIYSLGVVILEVLLWTPFITETTADPGTTGIYLPFISSYTISSTGERVLSISDIFEQRALRLGESNGGLPNSYAGDSVKLASRPNATRNVWKSLATEDLAQTNQEASGIVLKCLDGGFTSATEVLQAIELVT
jgi:serine/threonine protein kinase